MRRKEEFFFYQIVNLLKVIVKWRCKIIYFVDI